MTIKIISNAPTATPSTSLFKQPGSANAGAIDLFSSLLGGQLGELDSLLGDTLNKSTLQSEDAALSPLARKLKALKNTPEITQEATPPTPDTNLAAMLSAAALLPLPARISAPARDPDAVTEGSTQPELGVSTDLLVSADAEQAATSQTITSPALAQVPGTTTVAAPSPALAQVPGTTTVAAPSPALAQVPGTTTVAAPSSETSDTESAAAANTSAAWVDPKLAPAPATSQQSPALTSAEQKPRVELAVATELPSKTAAELAANGQKSRQDAADFTQALKETVAEATTSTAPLASDGRQIQVAVPSAQRGAPAHVITIPTPVGQPQWADDVGQQVVVMMNSRLETAQLQVTPPDMGPVEISLKMGNDGSAQLSFVSGVAETRQALEQGLPRLSAMLADNGIRLADAQVSSGQGQNSRDASQFAQQGQAGQGQGQPGGQANGRPATAQELIAAGLPADTVAVNMPIPSSDVSIYA